jgi:hypothetical protein
VSTPIRTGQPGRRQLGLSLRGARKGVGHAGERHREAIAPGGEDEPAMTADQATDKRVVARQVGAHAIGVVLPAPGRAFDVRKQEGHGP